MTAPRPRARLRGGARTDVEVERDDLRELLRAIVDSLDVPEGPEQASLLHRRAALIVSAGHAILSGRTPTPEIPWESAFLRRKAAEDASADKPVPFVLTDKADTAVTHG